MAAAKPIEVGTNLADKLRRTMRQVHSLRKDGDNQAMRYRFVSHDHAAKSISKALGEQNVAFGAEVTDVVTTATGGSNKQGPIWRIIVKTRYSFTCTDTGETRHHDWAGEGVDSMDKALIKAITQSKKTFLISTFLIATGDRDSDADFGEPVQSSPSRNQNRNQRSETPTARPNKSASADGGGRPDDREKAVARIRRGASDRKGSMDWDAVAKAISQMNAPGPFDINKPGFQGWTINQLNELAWVLTDGDDDLSPVGGEDQWR